MMSATYRDACKPGDHWTTPADAYALLAPYVAAGSIIWEPHYDDGACADVMRAAFAGCKVVHENADARSFVCRHDVVITNCAWSQKYDVLDWLLNDHPKPFAMLVPLTMLVTRKFRAVLNSDKVQVVLPTHRIHYGRDGATVKGCSFDSCWITHGFNLPRDIMWENVQV